RAAGVAFSCDPRSGRRDLVIINAARDFGDAVVGGRISPEEIAVVHRQGRLRVCKRRDQPDLVLTDEQALELARLTYRVHWALGAGQHPQDIEWAHDGRCFWLLQARPVTRMARATFPAIAGLLEIWSNANLKDNLDRPPTTLTWSLLQPLLREILYAAV